MDKKIVKKPIDPMAYATEIMQQMKKGITITTKSGERVNLMTISWGHLGVEWSVTTFVAYIRTGRFTHKQLEEHGEFTINIPTSKFKANKILGYVGTKSGRDCDKVADMNLHLSDGEQVSVPGILELPLTLECKVVYKQDQDLSKLPQEFRDKFYPANQPSDFHGANQDLHTVYYGEIVNAYILEEQ